MNNSEKNFTNEELVEIVPRVQTFTLSSLLAKKKDDMRFLNRWLLKTLRGLDYESRGRLSNFMDALQVEQLCTRGSYKESLYRFVALIDQVEKKIQAEEFSQRLLTASSQLPRKNQKALLEFAEQQVVKPEPKPETEKDEVSKSRFIGKRMTEEDMLNMKPGEEAVIDDDGIVVSHSLSPTKPKLTWQYPFWVNEKGERFCPRCYEEKRLCLVILQGEKWTCMVCDWELSVADAQDEPETGS